MTQNDKLKTLKLLAKRYARATGQPQHVALDLVANRMGFAHWNALTGNAKGEWVPSEAQVATIKAFVERITSYEGSPSVKIVVNRLLQNSAILRGVSAEDVDFIFHPSISGAAQLSK